MNTTIKAPARSKREPVLPPMPKTRRFQIKWGPIVIVTTIVVVWCAPLAFFAYSLVSTSYMKEGEKAFNLEQYGRARDNYYSAMEWGGSQKAYSQYYASISQLGEFDRAVNEFSSLIEDDSDNYLAYFYRAETYRVLKKDELAYKDYKACVEIEPSSEVSKRATLSMNFLESKGIK